MTNIIGGLQAGWASASDAWQAAWRFPDLRLRRTFSQGLFNFAPYDMHANDYRLLVDKYVREGRDLTVAHDLASRDLYPIWKRERDAEERRRKPAQWVGLAVLVILMVGSIIVGFKERQTPTDRWFSCAIKHSVYTDTNPNGYSYDTDPAVTSACGPKPN